MKRALTWLRRIVLGVLALAVVLIGVAVIALHTDWGREQLRHQVERKLVQVFPGGAKVGRITGSVFGTLTIHDVMVRGRDGGDLATVGKVEARVALLPLLGMTARVDSVIATGVHLTIQKQPPPPEDDSEPMPFNVELPHIEVHDARVTIVSTEQTIELDDVDALASIVVSSGGDVSILAHVGGTWRDRAAPFGGAVAVFIGEHVTLPFAAVDVGGVSVIATRVNVDVPAGRATIAGSPAEISRLAPQVKLPDHVVLSVTAAPRGLDTHVVLSGAMGGSRVDGAVLANLHTGRASGVIGGEVAELGVYTEGKLTGRGRAVAALVTDGIRVTGAIVASSALADAPVVHAVIGLDGTEDQATAFVVAAGDGDLRVGAVGTLHRAGESYVVDTAHVGASTQDPGASSGNRAPVRGRVSVTATARGPVEALVVDGTFDGARIRYEDLAVRATHGRFSLVADRKLLGTAHAQLTGVSNAGTPIGSVTVDARRRSDQTIAVTARGRASAAPVVIDADAIVSIGDVVDIALGRYTIRSRKLVFGGRGGHVRIDDAQIAVRDVTLRSGTGSIGVEATVGRETKVLTAELVAASLPAAALDPTYRGTLSGKVAVTRRGTRWSGTGAFHGMGLVLGPDALPLDGVATVKVDGRLVTITGNVNNADLGGGRVAIEVLGPRDLTDTAAWMRVARGDLRAVTIGIDKLMLAAVTNGKFGGVVDGTLEIREGVPSGAIAVRGVPTPAGTADADITLTLTETGFVDVAGKATIAQLGSADLGARLQIPDRPFDPRAWKQLGANVINRATASARNIPVEPKLLAKLGFKGEYRGRVSAVAEIGTGFSSAQLTLDASEVRGEAIVRPIELHLEARADDADTTAALRVSSGPVTLLELTDARSPVTLDAWVASPGAALTSSLSGMLTIPKVEARELMAILGRTEILGGTAEGVFTLAGTLRMPDVVGRLDLRNIKVKPRLVGKPPPMLTHLHVDAEWIKQHARIKVTGIESSKGQLVLDVSGSPAHIASVTGKVLITQFDVAPIVVFLPGPLVGASGKITADLTFKGLSLSTGTLRGNLKISEGRIPLTPTIGTLRALTATVKIDDQGITSRIEGKIGGRDSAIKLETSSGLDGIQTDVRGSIANFAPITALQPKINGEVIGTFMRKGFVWTGELQVRNASVVVPEQSGVELLDAAVPEDVTFVDVPIVATKPKGRIPERPWLIANIELQPTRVSVPDYAVISNALATIAGRVTVSVGETIGLDGNITVEAGSVDVFGHRYRFEVGQVMFDGDLNPRLDMKLAHDFPDMTMFVRYSGRLDEIATREPEFSNEPGIYTQGQLLGFFLGGEPGGDPSLQSQEAAVGLGASLASTKLGKKVRNAFKLDVLGCQGAAGTSSASCRGGEWVTKKVYVEGKQKIAARPDENSSEGTVEYHWKPGRTLTVVGGDRLWGIDLLWRKRF